MTARLAAWWRRRYRIVLPLGLAAAILLTVGIAHAVRADDLTANSFLNPDSTADDGAATLAARLRAAGVTVVRMTNSYDAVAEAYRGDATLFVPEPQFVLSEQLQRIRYTTDSSQVVLLAPDVETFRRARIIDVTVSTWWTTHTTAPGCDLPAAAAAGPAAADLLEYTGPSVVSSCYGGGLVTLQDMQRTVLIAGASDPFRNDRIADAGNAALATALLGGKPKLIWLDLHRAEREIEPSIPPNPTVTVTETGGTGADPGGGAGNDGATEQPTRAAEQRQDNPIDLLLPVWVWAVIALCGLAALAYALSRARRFGPPVDEPLPVAAYARETIEGRGRLYRQARAPVDAFRGPRRAAVTHMRQLLGLPVGAPLDTIVEAVAATTRRHPDDVTAVLDAAPRNDAELVAAVAALDELIHALQDTPTREEPS